GKALKGYGAGLGPRGREVPAADAGRDRAVLCLCGRRARGRRQHRHNRSLLYRHIESTMDLLLDSNTWIAFAMLTALEIVLGIDNIIFISILVGRLPADQRDAARRL